MGAIKDKLIEILAFLPDEVIVIIVSMLPVIELRGAIPIGISLGLTPLYSFLISYIGTMIPVPFILLLIKEIFKIMGKTKAFHKLIKKITDRSLSKNGEKIEKYGIMGLIILVAIPLPGTGVWSGSLIASLLNLEFKKAFPAIALGNLIAGIAVLAISYGLFNIFA